MSTTYLEAALEGPAKEVGLGRKHKFVSLDFLTAEANGKVRVGGRIEVPMRVSTDRMITELAVLLTVRDRR